METSRSGSGPKDGGPRGENEEAHLGRGTGLQGKENGLAADLFAWHAGDLEFGGSQHGGCGGMGHRRGSFKGELNAVHPRTPCF